MLHTLESESDKNIQDIPSEGIRYWERVRFSPVFPIYLLNLHMTINGEKHNQPYIVSHPPALMVMIQELNAVKATDPEVSDLSFKVYKVRLEYGRMAEADRATIKRDLEWFQTKTREMADAEFAKMPPEEQERIRKQEFEALQKAQEALGLIAETVSGQTETEIEALGGEGVLAQKSSLIITP